MNLDKTNMIEKPSAQVVQRFQRPSVRHLFILIMSMMSASVLLIYFIDPKHDLAAGIFVGIGMSGITSFWAVVFGRQRIDIDGTTIRVSNFTTWHRWRTFDAEEVTGLSILPTIKEGFAIGLVATLRASPDRSWRRIDISTTSMMLKGVNHAIDSPLFLAFFAAVTTAHPGMKVGNLPYSYHGVLPRA